MTQNFISNVFTEEEIQNSGSNNQITCKLLQTVTIQNKTEN